MSKDQTIEPIEQRGIRFYEDTVMAVVASDGTVYVPVRPLCELIGVDWTAQSRRIKRDEILNDVSQGVAITTTPSTDGRGGGKQDMTALPLDYLNGWLFGMNPSRVSKPEVKEALLRYQRECYKVLFDAFSSGVAVRSDDELMQSQDPAAIGFRNALATARLARQHYYLSKQVDENTKQIGLIQAQLSNPMGMVTEEQAQQISEAVKAIATVLTERSGANAYGGVYSEMYRRYGITSYKHLPAGKFAHCMNWLREWWKELTDGADLPF